MRKTLFYIGLALIIISFIASVISYYLLIVGIPVFLIGCILVYLSKRKLKTKFLTTILPLVLYIPFTYAFLYLYNYSTPKTILIPSTFNGSLRIVFAEKCGSKYEEQRGNITLTFPENGILILNEDVDRHINYKYYLVDKSGNKTEIQEIYNLQERRANKPCVIVGASGVIGQAVVANAPNQKEQKDITFSDFYVYNKGTFNIEDIKSEQKFDSITTEIVNQCR